MPSGYNPYRDRIGRFASGPSGGSSGPPLANIKRADVRAETVSDNNSKPNDPAAGTLNASDAKGKGVEKMWGVKATGRKIKNEDGTEVPEYDFSERAKYVDTKLQDWRDRGIDTQALYKGKNGEYTAARRKAQEQLMEDLWQRQAQGVPNEGKAVMAGGLGGAGKGYTLKERLKIKERGAQDGADYFTINPDAIKEEMAKRGMIPKLDPKMTPMELSPLAHEEASMMAKSLAKRAYAQKKNIVWDFTMATPGSVNGKLDAMGDAGYGEISGMFVDVSVNKSVTQAQKRWHNGLVRFGEGKGDGGRFLPSSATADNAPQKTSKFRSKNRETFEAIKGKLDSYQVFDNEVGSSVVEKRGID
jgi:hypothetical protein